MSGGSSFKSPRGRDQSLVFLYLHHECVYTLNNSASRLRLNSSDCFSVKF